MVLHFRIPVVFSAAMTGEQIRFNNQNKTAETQQYRCRADSMSFFCYCKRWLIEAAFLKHFLFLAPCKHCDIICRSYIKESHPPLCLSNYCNVFVNNFVTVTEILFKKEFGFCISSQGPPFTGSWSTTRSQQETLLFLKLRHIHDQSY